MSGEIRGKRRPIRTIDELQRDVAIHAERNWPNRSDYRSALDLPFYRIVAVAGGLGENLLNFESDERLDPERNASVIRLLLGRLVIWAAEFCSRNCWSLREVVQEAAEDMGVQNVTDLDGRDREDGED